MQSSATVSVELISERCPQARQTNPASPGTLSHKLDSLMEVESEQETVRSMEELRRKLEDISRKASYQDTSQDNPCYDHTGDTLPEEGSRGPH